MLFGFFFFFFNDTATTEIYTLSLHDALPVSEELLLAALGRLRDGGAAVVVSTHDLALAHLFCDEVCLLNRHQFGFGPTATTLTPDLLRATYGGRALQLRGDNVILTQP